MMSIDWSNVRLHTPGGIPYKRISGPDIDQDENVTTAKETYLINASQVGAFHQESFPPPYVFGFFIILPERRRMPGANYFVTKKVSSKPHHDQLPADPFGSDANAPRTPSDTYQREYLVTVEYEINRESDTQRNQEQPETFLDHSVQVGGEFYELGVANFRYGEDGNDNGQPANSAGGDGKPVTQPNLTGAKLAIATIEHNFKWPFVVAPAWEAIFEMLGKVNQEAKTLWKLAPAETVLFSGVSGTQKFVWNGATASVQPWELDFKFSQRVCRDKTVTPNVDVTWNHVWSSEKKKWIKPFWLPTVATPSAKKYLYEKADLYKLFRTA